MSFLPRCLPLSLTYPKFISNSLHFFLCFNWCVCMYVCVCVLFNIKLKPIITYGSGRFYIILIYKYVFMFHICVYIYFYIDTFINKPKDEKFALNNQLLNYLNSFLGLIMSSAPSSSYLLVMLFLGIGIICFSQNVSMSEKS